MTEIPSYADCKVKVLNDDFYVNRFGIFKGKEYPARINYNSKRQLKNYSVYAPLRNEAFFFSPKEIEIIKKYK